MSYTPTQWKTGDVVTSAKLNKLEQGVADSGGAGALVVNAIYDETTESYLCDASWNDVKNACDSGAQVFLKIVGTVDPGGEWEETATYYYALLDLATHSRTGSSTSGETDYTAEFHNSYSCSMTDPDENMVLPAS